MGINVKTRNERAVNGKIMEKEIKARDLIWGGRLGIRVGDRIEDLP